MEPTIPVILDQLRLTKKYKNLSDSTIKSKIKRQYKLKTVKKDDLLSALSDETKENSKKKIVIEGKDYTEDELIKMIQYYNQHIVIPSKVPPLIDDIWNEILLRCSTASIKNMCLTNQRLNRICQTVNFWKQKFERDVLPQLVIVKSSERKLREIPKGSSKEEFIDKKIPPKMRELPKSINEWILSWVTMKQCYNIAIKLINNIFETNTFKSFTMCSEDMGLLEKEMLWLPSIILNHVKKIRRENIQVSLNYKVMKGKYQLEIDVEHYDEDSVSQEESEEKSEEKNDNLELNLSKDDFVYYLCLLLYYHGDESLFYLTNGDDMNFSFKELNKGSPSIRFFFPNW